MIGHLYVLLLWFYMEEMYVHIYTVVCVYLESSHLVQSNNLILCALFTRVLPTSIRHSIYPIHCRVPIDSLTLGV